MPKFYSLTTSERERLKRELLPLLTEAKSRGIELPREVLEIVSAQKTEIPIGSNGYFLRNDGQPFEPSPAQEAFIKSTSRYSLFVAGRGSGKSAAGSQKALFKIMQGESGVVINPDFQNMKLSTWPAFKEWIPWELVIPTQRHRKHEAWEPHEPFTMVLRVNGKEIKIYVKGLKDPGSARGPNVNWLWYDEGGRDETGVGFKIASASVRVGKEPQIWVTETPKSKEHWSYKFFIQQDIPKEAREAFATSVGDDRILVEWFHSSINDNKTHLDPGFYASILAAYPSGWMRKQEVEGEFADEGGQIGDRHWFDDHTMSPPEKPVKRVRFWDLAATEKKQAKDDPDEAVGSLISKFLLEQEGKKDKDNYCVEHQVAGCWAWEQLLEAIANTARHDGPFVPIVLEEEPGSGGKNQVAAVAAYFKGFPELASHKIIGQRARDVGDRVMAANHWFSVAADGRMWYCKGSWVEKFLSQLDGFTLITHDDRITSVTGGMTYLNPFKKWSRVPFISV